MKTIKYIFLLSCIISLSSCKKYFEDVNTSDNLPLDVPVNALLPAIEGHLSFAQGGDAARYTSIFTQYVTGASRQFASYQRYSFTESDFDNLWRLNLYGGPMQDLHVLISKATAKGYIHYQGVGEILMAYSLGLTSDLWGDIPFSEAFQGDVNLQPKFDSQQAIYNQIQTLLSAGITHLSATDDSEVIPGSEDLIYSGSVTKWLMLANGLKARYYIHLSKMDVANAQRAIDALNAGALSGNADDAVFVYGTTETTANPWYQYIEQRDDIVYDGYCIQTMVSKNDPRYPIYIDVNGDFWGEGYLSAFFSDINSPVPFFSFSEQKFIEAEANIRLGDTIAAYGALLDAIAANMSNLGVDPADEATYITANVDWAGTSDRLGLIMNEKYVAMFLQPEAWTDWRRTGYPVLSPNSGAVISEIPRRFTYPQSERLYNTHCPQTSNLVSPRLWWDQ